LRLSTKATEILEGAKPPIIYFTGAGAPPSPPPLDPVMASGIVRSCISDFLGEGEVSSRMEPRNAGKK